MKKILAATAAAALIVTVTACGCSASSDMGSVSGSVSTPSSSGSSLADSAPSVTDGSNYKIGLGFTASTAKSSAADADYDGSANFDLTACALCIDENNRIIDIRFDSIETGVAFDSAGAFTGDIESDILTKREQGDSYGMGAVSDIGKNWYEQVDALENWMRGKTVSEAMDISLSYDGDRAIPDEPDLTSSVTISVTDHLKALEKAYTDAVRDNESSGSSSSESSVSGSLGESSSDDYINESSSSAS